ncbi:penicillin-binding protein 1A [Gilvimarinus sp. SDUM040013]|uniref:Penicillin-binding protein 1A n=1 Tax=Gilvimarinus gilvus TaxID=3058038 RepID=A0ABU4RYB5_9GAMM|nr:penicillin-binding protein 1A [Gilvimarinus sp. SDUM040013]MDO3387391.1 penicillin-binding protein 1A [Gilvimarinus sp. SDUM040013]MDX6849868.1 penicillin-binding protein 1A [Gilvimarinus sp. SDUM040013]
MTGVTFAGLYLFLAPKLPDVQTLREVKLQTPLRIYSSDNKLIGEFGEQRRTPISYNEIPPLYIKALLSAEDAQFYDHNGVSIRGLLRAASQLLQTGQIQSGGSTITMQVARNFFLTFRQTFARKFNEILLALQIERELTKAEILELYSNKIYFGNRAYGIQAAANVYYGKDISELSLAQWAMIAGLPKAPSAYNPLANPERALIRRNWILGRMLELGNIDQATYNGAIQEPISAKYHGLTPELYAPYVAEMARQYAIDQFGNAAYNDGYIIYTTVNSRLQEVAQQVLVEGVITYDQRHGYRGAEANLGLENPDSWLDQLDSFPTFGDLRPAVVTAIDEQSADIQFADASTYQLQWEDGLSSARPYVNESYRGKRPQTTSDIVKPAEVIRVKASEEGWKLSQLPEAEAALVSLNPENGAIVSLVGGFDFNKSNFNRVTLSTRQPGSSFKPFIYTTALENGFTPATIINDAPIVIEDASLEGTWRPVNDGGSFLGPMRMRTALYRSRNLVSIRILRSIGMEAAHRGIGRFGFDAEALPYDLSLALGSHDVTPLQLAEGYATFANGGFKVSPFLISRIENVDGEVLFAAAPATVCRECEGKSLAPHVNEEAPEAQTLEELLGSKADTAAKDPQPELPRAPRVLDAETAFIADSMLRDVIARGTGRRARVLERGDIAGKTGTTNGPRDAWFAGYNPNITTITWLGFDNNTNLGNNEYGGSAALPIWIDYMREALKDHPEVPARRPEGIVTVRIDPETGKRASANDPDAIFEIFRADSVPTAPETDANTQDNGTVDILPEELF